MGAPTAPSTLRLRLRRPKLARLLLLLVGGPDRLARLGLLERNRLRFLGDQFDRFAGPDVVGDHRVAAVGAQPLEQLLWGRSFVLGAVLEGLEQLLFADLDLLLF